MNNNWSVYDNGMMRPATDFEKNKYAIEAIDSYNEGVQGLSWIAGLTMMVYLMIHLRSVHPLGLRLVMAVLGGLFTKVGFGMVLIVGIAYEVVKLLIRIHFL